MYTHTQIWICSIQKNNHFQAKRWKLYIFLCSLWVQVREFWSRMNLRPGKRSLWKPLHWGAFIICDQSYQFIYSQEPPAKLQFFPAGLASSRGKPKLWGKIAYLSLAHVLDLVRNWNWALELGDSLMKQSVKIVPFPHYYTSMSIGFKNSEHILPYQ